MLSDIFQEFANINMFFCFEVCSAETSALDLEYGLSRPRPATLSHGPLEMCLAIGEQN